MNQATSGGAGTTPDFLLGGGEMGRRIREYDWSKTSLGPTNTWPKSLQTCIRIMLASRQPIWIGWGKDLIKFYNDPYKSIVGGMHPWALGSPASVVWKNIWPQIEPMLRQVMEEDEGTYVEEQLLIMDRNGYAEETYYTFSYTPIPGDEGGTAGMICANTDDTQRIISDRQLRTLTEMGNALIDCKTDQDVYATAIQTLAHNPHDFPFALCYTLSGDTLTLAAHTKLEEGDLGRIQRVLNIHAGTETSQYAERALTQRTKEILPGLQERVGITTMGAWKVAPDNSVIIPIAHASQKDPYGILVVGANPHRLLDDKYMGFFGMIGDQIATSLSTVHATEVERKRVEALAEIDKAKTTFFSNISHEFRTPLTLLLGPIRDAMNEPEKVDSNKQRMDVAYRNALRMQKLVNMLLDFSRIEAGRMDANLKSTNISELTEDLVSTFRSAIEKAGMKLLVDVSKFDTPVMVDVDMWEKIVLNLVSNAFKYSTEGTIAVVLRRIDNQIELSVSDTGHGIPESELDKIFERFHRVQNVAGRSQEGTGIGLAMVKELVKLHSGTIQVRSKLKEGSTFTVTIPVRIGETVKPEKIENHIADSESYREEAQQWIDLVATAEPTNASAKKLTVVLADDNRDMRLYIQRLLSEEYRVIETTNGENAYLKALELRPDAVITDIMMPVLDGFGLIKKLRSNQLTRHIPVIVLSARAGEESKVEGIRAGADDYLVKPFSSKELMAKVHSLISMSKERARSEAHLRQLFRNAPVPIAIMQGRDYILELANEQYLNLIEKTEEVIGMKLFDIVPELKTQGIEELLSSVMETGKPYIGNELELNLKRSGQIVPVFFNFVYQPMFNEEGTAYGVFVACNDVTELVNARRTAERYSNRLEQVVADRTSDLKKSNEELIRTNKELEQFAYVSSHDLQEPLRKIQTFTGMVKDKIGDLDFSKRYLEKIDSSAARMSSLIKDVLKYSQVTKAEKNFEVIDLNETLNNVKNEF